MGFLDRLKPKEPRPFGDPPPATARMVGKKDSYIDSIRWKGEIYCPNCGSPLMRIPSSSRWFEAPNYNPMTGAKLTDREMYGDTGLMVCQKWEEARSKPPPAMSIFDRPRSFQAYFEAQERPSHGMYYTDKPPLT
jgi:hypothetical protein